MNSLFESHEKQYGNITSEITMCIGQLLNQIRSSEDKKKLIRKIDQLFTDAKDLLQQMELEMSSVDVTLRNKYKNRWESHGKELKNLEIEFKNAKFQQSNGYGEVNGRNELYAGFIDTDQRDQLIKNTERLERGGDKLDEGYRIAVETEGLGTQILQDLGEQKEKLTRGLGRLRETNEDLTSSSRLLTRMTRKVMQNRLLMAIIAIVMFLVVGLTLYIVIRRSSTIPPSNTAINSSSKSTIITTTKPTSR